MRGAGPQGDWGCQVNTNCTYPNCIYQEKCPDRTLINSAPCNELHQSCPRCGVDWDLVSHLHTCRDLQATKALLREALGLLEDTPATLSDCEAWVLWERRRENLLARAGKQGEVK